MAFSIFIDYVGEEFIFKIAKVRNITFSKALRFVTIYVCNKGATRLVFVAV